MSILKNNHDTPECEYVHTSETEKSNIFDMISSFASFASLLRVGGAMIMLVAMSTYLLQGWSDGNDINRYYMLLSQTLLLAAGGFCLSILLKENKGARIFFGLGLISITVNMTTLGALLFSSMQWGSEVIQYPNIAKWIAPDSGAIMMALLGTLIISLPVAWTGHKVLARRSANILFALFLFTNMLLLLPMRESIAVGIIVLAAVIIPLLLIYKRMAQDNTLRTPEGMFAMATVFVPAGIIICRSIWLYPVDEVLQIILAGTAFTALRFTAQQTDASSYARKLTHWLSLGAALGMSIPAAILIDRFISGTLAYNTFAIVFSLSLFDISRRCKNPESPIQVASVVLGASHILTAIYMHEISTVIMCILAGVLIISVGRQYGFRDVMVIGLVTLLAGAGRQIFDFATWIDFSNWITLSMTGGTIIIAASLIERHGAVIKLKWDQFIKLANIEQE